MTRENVSWKIEIAYKQYCMKIENSRAKSSYIRWHEACTLNSQKTPHISPLRASYGVCSESFLESDNETLLCYVILTV